PRSRAIPRRTDRAYPGAPPGRCRAPDAPYRRRRARWAPPGLRASTRARRPRSARALLEVPQDLIDVLRVLDPAVELEVQLGGGVWVVASCQKKLVLVSTIRAPSAASTRWSASRNTLSACRRSVATTHAVNSARCHRSWWSVSAAETLKRLWRRSLRLLRTCR